MTDPTPEELPESVPPPTELELVARLAAEAAVRARPDLSPRLEAAEASLAEILAALAAAAGPDGNAAKLNARLAAVEESIAALVAAPDQPHPGQQQLIDDLRLKVAILERKEA